MTAKRAALGSSSLVALAFAATTTGCASGRFGIDVNQTVGSMPTTVRSVLGMGAPQDAMAVVGQYTLIVPQKANRSDDYTNGWTFPLPHSEQGRNIARTEYDRNNPYAPRLRGERFYIIQPMTGPGATRAAECARSPFRDFTAKCNEGSTTPTFAYLSMGQGVQGGNYNGVIAAELNCREVKPIEGHRTALCQVTGRYSAMTNNGLLQPVR